MAPTLSQKWACDLPGSAIVIFLHPFAASAMAAKAVGKPAWAMRPLTFGNETAHRGIVKNSWAPRRAVQDRFPKTRPVGQNLTSGKLGPDAADTLRRVEHGNVLRPRHQAGCEHQFLI